MERGKSLFPTSCWALVVYFIIVHTTLPLIEVQLGVVFLSFFLASLFYSAFVYCISLLSRHGVATIFVSVVYVVLEIITAQFTLLKLENPSSFIRTFFTTGLLDMVVANWQEDFWLAVIQVPLLYALAFSVIVFVRIKTMSFK